MNAIGRTQNLADYARKGNKKEILSRFNKTI
jgi:hypothetical protein